MNRGTASFYFRSGNMIVIVEVLLLDGENDCSYIYDLRTIKSLYFASRTILKKTTVRIFTIYEQLICWPLNHDLPEP